jgi:hypothetical protein
MSFLLFVLLTMFAESTFMKKGKRWMFGLCVLMVSLHTYHLYLLVFHGGLRSRCGSDWINGFYGGGKLVELQL